MTYTGSHGYLVNKRGEHDLVHRAIWEREHGPIPAGMVIDHIDGDKLNNDLSNLRCVPQHINCLNRQAPNKNNKSSGVRGVTWCKKTKKWRAQIMYKRTNYNLGRYATIDEAARAVERELAVLMTAPEPK